MGGLSGGLSRRRLFHPIKVRHDFLRKLVSEVDLSVESLNADTRSTPYEGATTTKDAEVPAVTGCPFRRLVVEDLVDRNETEAEPEG